MKNVFGNKNPVGSPNLQDLLDAVPADQKVACLPTPEALVLYAGDKELGRIPLDGLADVSLIDDSSVQKHYTLSRILTIGPLVLLFPKKTFHEAYRLCIQWKDSEGGFNFTYIRIATRIMANHMLSAVQRVLTPEGRKKLAQTAPKTIEWESITEKEQRQLSAETSPFITCGNCTVEFRKTDLPPGGKCPVCGKRFNNDAKKDRWWK
jgi:hypothetical protein